MRALAGRWDGLGPGGLGFGLAGPPARSPPPPPHLRPEALGALRKAPPPGGELTPLTTAHAPPPVWGVRPVCPPPPVWGVRPGSWDAPRESIRRSLGCSVPVLPLDHPQPCEGARGVAGARGHATAPQGTTLVSTVQPGTNRPQWGETFEFELGVCVGPRLGGVPAFRVGEGVRRRWAGAAGGRQGMP